MVASNRPTAMLLCLFLVATLPLDIAAVKQHAAAGSLLQAYETDLDRSASPVDNLLKLLKDMSSTLQKELEEDEKTHTKLGCWCETNEKEKSAAVAEEEQKVQELTTEIEQQKAASAEYSAKIKELTTQLEADKQTLSDAKAMREKQNKDFMEAEPKSAATIKSLANAISILDKHSGVALPQLSFSFLTVDAEAHRRKQVPWAEGHESDEERSLDDFMRRDDIEAKPSEAASVSDMPAADPDRSGFLQRVTPEPQEPAAPVAPKWSAADIAAVQKAIHSAKAFAQVKQTGEYFPSYSDHSGEIVGILKQMKEQMEDDLSEARRTESESASSFEELNEAKKSEIADSKMLDEEKEDKLAEADVALHTAKRDLKQTEDSLAENQKFLANLKKNCDEASSDFEERKKARMEEAKAVDETISILTSDDAKDAFKEGYSLLQVSSEKHGHALTILKKLAHGNPRFSALVMSMERNPFARVNVAINNTIISLRNEQAEEVKEHDYCVKEMHDLDMDKEKLDNDKADLEAKVAAKKSVAEKTGSEIDHAKEQVSQLQVDLQAAAESRLVENTDFQKTVSQQRLTQEFLTKALRRLRDFYEKEDSFVQKKASLQQDPKPPMQQMGYEKSAAGGGVLQLIKKMVLDSKAVEQEAVKGEQEAEAQYETFVSDTKKAIAPLLELIASKAADKASAEEERENAESELSQTVDQMEHLDTEKSEALHKECDYLLKYFEERQQARMKEIDQLWQAWTYLKDEKVA